jgi:hypothetical protein
MEQGYVIRGSDETQASCHALGLELAPPVFSVLTGIDYLVSVKVSSELTGDSLSAGQVENTYAFKRSPSIDFTSINAVP